MNSVVRAALIGATVFFAATASADVLLRSKEQLVMALKINPPCCVIDGRDENKRRQKPLAEALPYRAGIKINPTASVVVLADTDREAMKIGTALAKSHPGKTIMVVKGGMPAWEAVMESLTGATATGASGKGGIDFVIPKNTCESGELLQQLRSQTK